MGFRDGDKVVEIDGQPIEDVNDIRAMLLLTEGDRHVTIERDGRSDATATGGFIFVVATTGQRRECCQSSKHKCFDFHTH